MTYECSLDGAPFAPCESRPTYSGLGAGDARLQARATDAAGNVDETPAVFTWTIIDGDAIAPDTVLTAAPPAETTSESTARFEFFGTDDSPGTLTFECSIGAPGAHGPFEPCSSPKDYEILGGGEYAFLVRAVDAAGNKDQSPAQYIWNVLDETPPETQLNPPLPADGSTAPVTFNFTGTDNTTVEEGAAVELEFECSLDKRAWTGCATALVGIPASYRIAELSGGSHTFEVRAVDAFGNVDGTPAAHTWTAATPPDTTAPDTNIGSGPSATTTETSATFVFGASEPGATFECSLDGADFAECVSPQEFTDLAPGNHNFRVRAKDAAGNVDGTPALYPWTIQAPPDQTEPETTIDSGPSAPTRSTAATFTFSSEPGASFECALDAAGYSSCTSPRELTGLSVGEHTFRVRAKDAAGNYDSTPATRTWTVTEPPETTITLAPDAETEATTAKFEFTSEPGATFECALDSDIYVPCNSGDVYSELAFGDHDFSVRAVDGEGNVDPTAAAYGWTIGDMTPPVVSIESGPTPVSGMEQTTNSRSASFTISVNDPDAVMQCSIDGATPRVCTSPAEYSDLPAGEHTFELTAVKHNLLVDVEPVIWEWTIVDNTAPETEITSRPSEQIGLETAAAYAFSSNEADATFECSLDGEPFSSCPTPPEFSGLEAGEHTLEVRAVDPSLNADATPASDSFTVMGTPVTSFSVAPDAETESTTARFEFAADHDGASYMCSLDGSRWAPCTSAGRALRPARGQPRVRGHRDQLLGCRGAAGEPRLDDRPAARHHGARYVHRHPPAQPGLQHDRELQLLLERARRLLRVLARRRCLRGLRRAARDHRADARASTRSRSGPPTLPATSTRRRRATPGRSRSLRRRTPRPERA